VEEVDLSFYGTVYNSAKYIRRSLTSIVEVVLELKKHGITSEIVVVDNYSSDGTWEIMNELKKLYAEKGLKIRLVRYKCSRGFGRNIALRLTCSKYLFFVDLDVEYDVHNLTKIITNYMKSLKGMCLYIFLTPRFVALNAGGIHDLNRTEDIEFCARLIKYSIVLPVVDESFRILSDNIFMNGLDSYEAETMFFISTYLSERRYAKGLRGYIKRELRNKIDMICGMGYTWKKLLREAVYLCNIFSLKSSLRILLWLLYHTTFYILVRILRRKIYSHHNAINNGSLCDIAMFLNYIALKINMLKNGLGSVTELRRWVKEALTNKDLAKVIAYFHSLEPDALRQALRGQYFILSDKVEACFNG